MTTTPSTSDSPFQLYWNHVGGLPSRIEVPDGVFYLRDLDTGEVWPISRSGKPLVLGHGEGVKVACGEPGESPWRVSVRRAPWAVSVVDLKSRAGTWFGGEALRQRVVGRGVVMELGQERQCHLAVFVTEGEEPRAEVYIDGVCVARRTVSTGPVVVGRSSQCDLPVPVSFVSRQHVRLMPLLGPYLIEAPAGSWGRFSLRGTSPGGGVLVPGDVVKIGGRRLGFAGERAPVAPPGEGWRLLAKGVKVALDRPHMTLGRDEECEICLQGIEGISRQHVRLFWRADGFLGVHDLGSAMGMQVNGRRLAYTVLRSEGVLQLGNWRALLAPPGL